MVKSGHVGWGGKTEALSDSLLGYEYILCSYTIILAAPPFPEFLLEREL